MNKQNNNRTRWLHVRLKQGEYNTLYKNFSKTTCRKLSDYARKILLNKPLTTTYRNQSFDDLIAEMALLRRELNHIGNNFNQAVKRLHTLSKITEFKSWLITYEIEKKILFNKVDEIKKQILKITEKW